MILSFTEGMDINRMKKIRIFFTALLICTSLLTACEKKDDVTLSTTENDQQPSNMSGEELIQEESAEEDREDKLPAEQKEAYNFYIDELDRMLSANRRQEQESDIYQESIGTIYLFSHSAYTGGLQANYREEGTTAFQMVLTDEETGEQQKYDCRLLADGSLWFTYQTESGCGKNLPDYTVNEDVLRFSRTDYIYDDQNVDLEEERQRKRQEMEAYMAKKIGGEVQEFWELQDRIYWIDREQEIFIDMTEEKETCIADFLWEQLRRVNCQINVSEDTIEEVEKYKPEGYSLLWGRNGWDEIAACDLNHDGRMDYVVVLYPDDYEEVQRYEDFSPYEHTSQYYAACFWLLLSTQDGGYEQITLSNSIEYWETELSLVEVGFVDEGILQLEYFVGRSPFSNAVLRFFYDEEEKNFYILRSYYRDSFGDALSIGDTDNYGKTSMVYYFSSVYPRHFEGVWQSVQDVPMQDGNMLGYYSDSFQYRCENLLEERHINSLIWEKEYELFLTLKQYYPLMDLDFHMVTDPTFYGPRLVSGQVELSGDAGDHYDFRTYMPIMVDKQEGTYVTVTGLLEKEEFAQIFDAWAEDELTYDRITVEEKEQCEGVIAKSWEKADLVENYLGNKEEILFLQIVQEGILMRVWSESDTIRGHDYLIDKEYFWGTNAWDYLKPEGR